MSKRKFVAREDINPVDASLEVLEETVNVLERQFSPLNRAVSSSDEQECTRIFRHVRSTLMYYQFSRAPVPPAPTEAKQEKVAEVQVAEVQVEAFNAAINLLLDCLPVRYSPTSSSSDDEPVAGSRGGGGCAAPGASVFKKARRGATKTTLRLKAGLDDQKDDDKSVSSSDKPGYDSEEVNTNVVDDTEVKKVDDDVNGKKVDNEEDT